MSASPISIPHHTYILSITYSSPSTPLTTICKIGYSANVPKRVSSLSSLEKPSSIVRGKGIKLHNISILATVTHPDKLAAVSFEKYLHSKHHPHKYKGTPVLANGNSELYTTNIADLELVDSNSLFVKYNPS